MRDAINLAVDKLAKQAAARASGSWTAAGAPTAAQENGQHWPLEVLARESFGDAGAPRSSSRRRLPIKPMTIEEAALALEDSRARLRRLPRRGARRGLSVLYQAPRTATTA